VETALVARRRVGAIDTPTLRGARALLLRRQLPKRFGSVWKLRMAARRRVGAIGTSPRRGACALLLRGQYPSASVYAVFYRFRRSVPWPVFLITIRCILRQFSCNYEPFGQDSRRLFLDEKAT